MNLPADQQETINQLLLQGERDDTHVNSLALNYVYFAASSNIEFINEYQAKVIAVLNKWQGSLRIAKPLIHLVNGYSLFFLTKPKEGLKEFDTMFTLCEDTNLFRGIKGAGYTGRGVCYRSLGRFDKTMEDCLLAVQLIQEGDPPELWQGYVYRMLGEIHTYIRELDEAIQYYLKAKAVMDSFSGSLGTTGQFRVLDALGNCFYEMGEKEKARKFLEAAMNVEGLSNAEKARVLCDFGILNIDDPQKALELFEESCQIRKEAQLEDAYTTSLIYKGECLIKLEKLKEAEDALIEASKLVEKYKVPTKRLHLYQQFGALNEQKSNYKEANNYFHMYDQLKSEIHEEQTKNIFHIKNKQIADQHQEIQKKHYELRNTLDELAKIKVSRKALLYSIITLVVLVVITEMFLEPVIDAYSSNQYLSIGTKVFIAFLLKPIDSFYEKLLIKRAYRK